jgi:hypothetical protein
VKAILDHYLPIELTHDEYPALIPQGTSVPTIGNRALLVTYAWPENSPRYNRLAKFVQEFFGKINQFQDVARHPKWREFSAEAEIPGWTRFKPAADWIAQNRQVAMTQNIGAPLSGDIKAVLEEYVSQYVASTGKKALSDNEREALFVKFQQFLVTRNRQ